MNDLFAKALADAGDSEQAEFLNVFASRLKTVCKTSSYVERQLCEIAEHLDANAREVLKFLVEFADLVVENRAKHEKERSEYWRELRELEEQKRKAEQELEELQNQLDALKTDN